MFLAHSRLTAIPHFAYVFSTQLQKRSSLSSFAPNHSLRFSSNHLCIIKKRLKQKFNLFFIWAGVDSNHRSLATADLQSAPFSHSGTYPYVYIKFSNLGLIYPCIAPSGGIFVQFPHRRKLILNQFSSESTTVLLGHLPLFNFQNCL